MSFNCIFLASSFISSMRISQDANNHRSKPLVEGILAVLEGLKHNYNVHFR